ncbi:MAG: hypothetical protein QF464_15365, partial [Myxococcota bacterium]|nr:hypothetical protein [Myxococcota bacterium]
EDLPATVPVTVYTLVADNWVALDVDYTPSIVPSGETTVGLVFDLEASAIPEGVLKFVVDDEEGVQYISECHEDNNELVITSGLCP